MNLNSARNNFVRILLATSLTIAALALFAQRGYADEIPKGWEASNLKPIGYSDMDGRAGNIKMAIKHVGDKWYLYVAHLWVHGWTIVDVTDPTNPKVVKFIPGPPNGDTNQVDLHDNIMITALQNRAAYQSHDMDVPRDEGVIIWDISDPVNPKELSRWKTNGTGTHRDGYPGGKYANLAAGMPGYNGQILVFLDVSDPANPNTPLFDLGFGTPYLLNNSLRVAYAEDAALNPDGAVPPTLKAGAPLAAVPPTQTFRLAFYQNDLRNGKWTPTSPTLLCGGDQDPTVFFLNTATMAAFWSALPAGLVTVLDVSAAPSGTFQAIQAGFQGSEAALLAFYQSAAGGSLSLAAAEQQLVENYHTNVAPFCALAARSFFSQL